MQEKTKMSVMETLIAEMSKPHITLSGRAGLEALAKSQKILMKPTK
jgi:hypothetical protein